MWEELPQEHIELLVAEVDRLLRWSNFLTFSLTKSTSFNVHCLLSERSKTCCKSLDDVHCCCCVRLDKHRSVPHPRQRQLRRSYKQPPAPGRPRPRPVELAAGRAVSCRQQINATRTMATTGDTQLAGLRVKSGERITIHFAICNATGAINRVCCTSTKLKTKRDIMKGKRNNETDNHCNQKTLNVFLPRDVLPVRSSLSKLYIYSLFRTNAADIHKT